MVENVVFVEKTFMKCLLVPPNTVPPPNFAKKTFANSHKNSKFAKVFSLKVPAVRKFQFSVAKV